MKQKPNEIPYKLPKSDPPVPIAGDPTDVDGFLKRISLSPHDMNPYAQMTDFIDYQEVARNLPYTPMYLLGAFRQDEALNTIPLKQWDSHCGFQPYLKNGREQYQAIPSPFRTELEKRGIKSGAPGQYVCIMKECVKRYLCDILVASCWDKDQFHICIEFQPWAAKQLRRIMKHLADRPVLDDEKAWIQKVRETIDKNEKLDDAAFAWCCSGYRSPLAFTLTKLWNEMYDTEFYVKKTRLGDPIIMADATSENLFWLIHLRHDIDLSRPIHSCGAYGGSCKLLLA